MRAVVWKLAFGLVPLMIVTCIGPYLLLEDPMRRVAAWGWGFAFTGHIGWSLQVDVGARWRKRYFAAAERLRALRSGRGNRPEGPYR